ncbi:MAG: leucine zipper domain-containing protein [Rhodospirillales bacterium]
MPWEVSSVLERRIRFVLDVERGELPLTAVCEAHGISRTTGYKWLERHASWGISGLSDRPRTPGRLARAMAPEIASAIVAARTRYPHWGPKKLRAWLLREQPEAAGRRHRRWAICCAGVV